MANPNQELSHLQEDCKSKFFFLHSRFANIFLCAIDNSRNRRVMKLSRRIHVFMTKKMRYYKYII